MVKEGYKDWYFLTVDHAFGHALEKDAANVVKANGGNVKGAVRHPLSAPDFSSYMLQAQSWGAQVHDLAHSAADTSNADKTANEYGIPNTMKMAGLLVNSTDIKPMGQDRTQGRK